MRNSIDFVKEYKNHFNHFELVASSETMCIPGICTPIEYLKKSLNRRKYANAGLMCGTLKGLHTFWKEALESNLKDDQFFLGKYINVSLQRESIKKIAIDVENILMQTSAPPEMDQSMENSVLEKTLLGQQSFFLHLPALKYFPKQRKKYSDILKQVANRTNVSHVLTTEWATRYVPFELDIFTKKLLIALSICIVTIIILSYMYLKKL
jgi:hypothetical protein